MINRCTPLVLAVRPCFCIAYITGVYFRIMKITFKETLSRKEWLHKELTESLTDDIIIKASGDQFYDVKLLVNGVELEPAFYNKLVNNIEKYIDAEAKSLVRQKLEEAEEKSRKLSELIDAAKNSIIDEFNLDDENF